MSTARLFTVNWQQTGRRRPVVYPSDLYDQLVGRGDNVGDEYTVSFVKDGKLELPVNIDTTRRANYVMYNNGTGWLGAFIGGRRWTSNASTEFFYKEDWFTNYAYACSVEGITIRRKLPHDEYPTKNGDFNITGWKRLVGFSFDSYFSHRPPLVVYMNQEVSNLSFFEPQGYIATPLLVFFVQTDTEWQDFYNMLHEWNSSLTRIGEKIVAVYAIPDFMVPPSQNLQGVAISTGLTHTYNFRTIKPSLWEPGIKGNTAFVGDYINQNLSNYKILLNDHDARLNLRVGAQTMQIPISNIDLAGNWKITYGFSPRPFACLELPEKTDSNNPSPNSDRNANGGTKTKYCFSDFPMIEMTSETLMSHLIVAGLHTGLGIVSAVAGNPLLMSLEAQQAMQSFQTNQKVNTMGAKANIPSSAAVMSEREYGQLYAAQQAADAHSAQLVNSFASVVASNYSIPSQQIAVNGNTDVVSTAGFRLFDATIWIPANSDEALAYYDKFGFPVWEYGSFSPVQLPADSGREWFRQTVDAEIKSKIPGEAKEEIKAMFAAGVRGFKYQ